MTRIKSVLQNVGVGITREIDSRYDDVKIVADNIEAIITASEGANASSSYLGPSENPPLTRLDGSALQDGDYYFDTSIGVKATSYYSLADTSWSVPATSAVSSVNGQVGAIVIAKSDIALGNVDDTSDSAKPLSDATITALADKMSTSSQAAIDANTSKVSNVDHPLVGKAVPSNAIFTDTTYSVGDLGLTEKNFTTAKDAKLATIESNATSDQTGPEIKTSYESQTNTNAFTDAEKTKLGTVNSGAQANTVDSVNGQVGSTVVTKADLGLSQVANFLAIPATEKGAVNGVADLDSSGKVPTSQIPSVAHNHSKSEITDFSDSDYATAVQGTKADTALQPGSSNSTLTNDANFITLADIPTPIEIVASMPGTPTTGTLYIQV